VNIKDWSGWDIWNVTASRYQRVLENVDATTGKMRPSQCQLGSPFLYHGKNPQLLRQLRNHHLKLQKMSGSNVSESTLTAPNVPVPSTAEDCTEDALSSFNYVARFRDWMPAEWVRLEDKIDTPIKWNTPK